MRLTVERLPESHVRLDIAAEEAEIEEAFTKAVRRVSREIQVPGFRKGKAPRYVIERMFGREIFTEETNRVLMDDLYRKAIKEADVVPVGEPEVELVTAEPLEFKVTLPVYPTIDPGDYTSVRVEPKDASIDEGQVDEVIERMRVRSSPWVEVSEPRKPREGDQVTVDLTLTDEAGEQFQEPIEDAVFILGESQLFEPLRAAIEELNVGESTDVTMAFEEEDEAVSERLRGKAVTYHVALKSVKQRELLPLDDEFAKTWAGEETMEALRTAIRNDIHQARTNEVRNEVVAEIIEQIAERATIEIPAAMIDDAVTTELERLKTRLQYQRSSIDAYLRATGQSEEQLREELRPTVAARLRNSLVLREVAEREGIAVSDEDLEREVDEITSGAPDPERLRKVYSGDRYMRNVIRNDLFDKRLTDRLIEIATEGRGAVINGFVPPEGDGLAPASSGDEQPAAEADGAAPPVEAALAATTGSAAPAQADGESPSN